MSAATEELVDLGVDISKTVPCNGIDWRYLEVREDCPQPADFRLTFRCCKPVSAHKCTSHTDKYANGYTCTHCNKVSLDLEVRPLR